MCPKTVFYLFAVLKYPDVPDTYENGLEPPNTSLYIGSIPHPVMGTTGDYCRYIKVLLTQYLGTISVGGSDLSCTGRYSRYLGGLG